MRLPILLLLPILSVACSETPGPVALGTLERDRITLRATAAEIIREQPVREGSRVEAGDTLVVLDQRLQQQSVNRMASELSAARAELERLRNGFRAEEIASARARLEAAQAALREARRNHERLQVIAEQEFVPRADLETAETRRDNQAALVEEARHQLELMTSGSRPEDIARAEARVSAQEAALALERQRLEDLHITAPRAGLLERLPWEVGERVGAGTGVAILLVGDAPFARVYIPEPHLMKLSVGDSLPVSIDGLESPISGEIRWIASEAAFTPYFALNREERTRLMYLAEIELPASAADLPTGLPLQVELPE